MCEMSPAAIGTPRAISTASTSVAGAALRQYTLTGDDAQSLIQGNRKRYGQVAGNLNKRGSLVKSGHLSKARG